jgi:hypothetical protein
LKARASELAAQLKGDFGGVGFRAQATQSLAADLEEISNSGDLSELREKASRKKSGAAGAAEFSVEYSSLKFDALVSRFQAIKERSAAKTSDASNDSNEADAVAAKNQTPADDLISKIKTSLSDQLRALYTQGQIQSSTVSLSG